MPITIHSRDNKKGRVRAQSLNVHLPPLPLELTKGPVFDLDVIIPRISEEQKPNTPREAGHIYKIPAIQQSAPPSPVQTSSPKTPPSVISAANEHYEKMSESVNKINDLFGKLESTLSSRNVPTETSLSPPPLRRSFTGMRNSIPPTPKPIVFDKELTATPIFKKPFLKKRVSVPYPTLTSKK